jgi:hypothetical protein
MLKLKKIIKSLFSLIGFIMSKVVPVNEHLVVFGDLPGFRDALGEYEFVSNNFPEKNCVYVKRGSLTVRNILSCIFAKYYVYSCYPGDVSKVFFHGKTLINVWHGMPVKEIETNRTIKSYENEYYFPYLLSHKLAKQRYFLIPSPMIMQKFVDAFEDRVEQFVHLQTTRFASVAHDPRFNGQADGCLVIWSSFLNQEHQAVDTIKCLERELLNDFRFVLHSFHPLACMLLPSLF